MLGESEVRWGILGCGDVTEVKSGPALYKTPHSQVVAVMRRDGEKAADYARRHGIARSYESATDLINDPEVNAVYIATPPGSHCDYALQVAAAGKPAYVEKPMARTADECERMVQAFDAANLPLFVAYYRRRLPLFLKVEELLKAGTIGEVRTVRIELLQPPKASDLSGDTTWRVDPEIAGGGYFYDLASHQLDILDYLLGEVADARGFAVNQAGYYPAEDGVAAALRFESGVIGTGLWCYTCSEQAERDVIEIIGSKGSLVFSTFQDTPLQVFEKSGVQQFHFERPEHVSQPLVETVVADLLGNGACPSTGRSAARTNRVMEQIFSSKEACAAH